MRLRPSSLSLNLTTGSAAVIFATGKSQAHPDSGPVALPAASLIPPPLSTRPDLPPLAVPQAVAAPPPGTYPPASSLSPAFNVYIIPSQFTPFEYSFENSYFGSFDEPAFLGPDGSLVPSAATAGAFAIVTPQGYMLSLSLSRPTYFAASLHDLLAGYSSLEFPYAFAEIDAGELLGGAFSTGLAGAGLGTGLPAGFGLTNPKMSLASEHLETGDKTARFCASMTGQGTKWVFGSKLHVYGTQEEEVGDPGCEGVSLYVQIL
ncbi:hypothetical protein B2J93_3974 [Marssonina coronariae]|uniref:Uncharacterized protein n=1 Tax=Diplocarpon coronariae TaxID=2795749 RepID=A0A218YW18_9HELO|nr:hypothetical protein B2J93_3974 [Marssonina coronariae]